MASTRWFGTEISANRQRGHEFTPVQKAVIIEQLSSGKTHRAVAATFGTTPSTTHRIFKRWREEGTFENRPRPGQPKKLNEAEERYIITLVKRNRKITYKALVGAMNGRISLSTIRRVIRKTFRRKWKSIHQIHLTKEAAAKRLAFAHL